MSTLTLAIPSKGRLKDRSEDWLSASGFELRQLGGGRGYTASIKNLPDTRVMLLSARDIAQGLIHGDLHIGITGEDLVHELSADSKRDVHAFRRMGYGDADVIVAVPSAWLDVDTMSDLEAASAQFKARHGRQMRVATKYFNLTRRFFADRSVGEYRLIESAGATEAAPASGSAEVIVDITTTGATLKANQLKILSDGVILSSQATLFGSRHADWGGRAYSALERFLCGIEAAAAGRQLRLLQSGRAIPDTALEAHPLRSVGPMSALCEQAHASLVARELSRQLNTTVSISPVDQVFMPGNHVFDDFVKKMS